MFTIDSKQIEQMDEEWRKASAVRLRHAIKEDSRCAALQMPDAELESIIQRALQAAQHMELSLESDTLRLLKLLLFHPEMHGSNPRGEYARRLLIRDEDSDHRARIRMAELVMNEIPAID